MKHTLAVLLVAAAASKVQAINSCSDVTIRGDETDNMGVGQLVKVSGSAYASETTISGACLTALNGVDSDIAQTAAGCFEACESNAVVDADCAGADMWVLGFSWNEDTKDCTCYDLLEIIGPQDLPSIDLKAELGDDAYGCTYLYDAWLVTSVCEVDQGDVELDVAVSGEFDLEDYDCDTTVKLDDTKKAIETALEDECNAALDYGTQCTGICKATVTKLTVEGCDKDADTVGTLNVEFFLEKILEIANTIDVHIAEQVADYIFEELEDWLETDLANAGDIIDAINAEVAATVFDGVAVVSAVTLSDIISKALGDFGDFYPTWHNDDNTCVNDGKYPAYMANNNYFKSTLEDCCKQYYSWDFTNCMLEGGAEPFEYVNYEFYVDYESGTCKQSCPKDTEGMNCGGLHKNWQATYEDAEECCKDRLFWLNAEKCIAESNGEELDLADLGSDNYYVDWKDFKCVRDCDIKSGNGPDCGGLAEAWDIPFDSKSDCCSGMLGWKDQDECNSE